MKRMIGLLLALCAVTAGVGCAEEEEAGGYVLVDYSITTNTTWRSGVTYRIDNNIYGVTGTAVLTIEPGAIIKFDANGGYYVDDGARIIAAGTTASNIVFTSSRDNSIGATVKAGTPATGDWQDIYIEEATNCVFRHCRFSYGGSDEYRGVLTLGSQATVVEYCDFEHNSGACALYAFQMTTPATSIKSNTFRNCDRPLGISPAMHMMPAFGNVFGPGNRRNQIAVSANPTGNGGGWNDGAATVAIHYGVTNVAFVFMDGIVQYQIGTGCKLHLHDNVTVKFSQAQGGLLFSHTANNLHVGSGVRFTSINDDGIAGDSNGDGTTVAPAAGDWDGIQDVDDSAYVCNSGQQFYRTDHSADSYGEKTHSFPVPAAF